MSSNHTQALVFCNHDRSYHFDYAKISYKRHHVCMSVIIKTSYVIQGVLAARINNASISTNKGIFYSILFYLMPVKQKCRKQDTICLIIT